MNNLNKYFTSNVSFSLLYFEYKIQENESFIKKRISNLNTSMKQLNKFLYKTLDHISLKIRLTVNLGFKVAIKVLQKYKNIDFTKISFIKVSFKLKKIVNLILKG